ncbi:unnamed protein product [Closterium sp. Naga37s-1]|nr:unnamed protein product [Closterium sp. Naga37s-1]
MAYGDDDEYDRAAGAGVPMGSWTTGCCACADDCAGALCACMCPCVVVGRIAEVVTDGYTDACVAACLFCCMQLCSMGALGCCYSHCERAGTLGMGCMGCMGNGWGMDGDEWNVFRARLRHNYMLPAEPCPDCCKSQTTPLTFPSPSHPLPAPPPMSPPISPLPSTPVFRARLRHNYMLPAEPCLHLPLPSFPPPISPLSMRPAVFRARLRHNYMLPAEPCPDCCVHALCLCCALAQEHRELRNRGWDPRLGARTRIDARAHSAGLTSTGLGLEATGMAVTQVMRGAHE